MGTPAYFLRLKSCNMLCGGQLTAKDGKLHDGATWRCDSIEVWLKGKSKTFSEIVTAFGPDFIRNIDSMSHHLVITGGEPLLHQEMIVEFLLWLTQERGVQVYVEIETNGSIIPSDELVNLVDQWNISPKLSNSGVPVKKRVNGPAIIKFVEQTRTEVTFKFVVSGMSDFMEAVKTYVAPFNIPDHSIYLMPAADNEEDLKKVSQEVAEICVSEGIKLSSRLQVAIYNKKTGV